LEAHGASEYRSEAVGNLEEKIEFSTPVLLNQVLATVASAASPRRRSLERSIVECGPDVRGFAMDLPSILLTVLKYLLDGKSRVDVEEKRRRFSGLCLR